MGATPGIQARRARTSGGLLDRLDPAHPHEGLAHRHQAVVAEDEEDPLVAEVADDPWPLVEIGRTGVRTG
jgi:hypothetical protein